MSTKSTKKTPAKKPAPASAPVAATPPATDAASMLLRDYFAANAIKEIIASEYKDAFAPERWAREAYEIASAMMRARGAA